LLQVRQVFQIGDTLRRRNPVRDEVSRWPVVDRCRIDPQQFDATFFDQ
jgi:hypothetical protein